MSIIKIQIPAILRERYRVKLLAQRYLRAVYTTLIRGIFAALVFEKVYNKTNVNNCVNNTTHNETGRLVSLPVIHILGSGYVESRNSKTTH